MPMTVSCDDCGKTYSISSKMAGRRVKCKACGQAFTIASPTRLSSPTPVPAAVASDAVANSPWPGRILEILPRIYPNAWVLLACAGFAVLVGFMGKSIPTIWICTVYGFPVLAGLFLLVGMFVLLDPARRTAGYFNFPWKDSLSTIFVLLIGGVLGILILRYRRDMHVQVGPFWNKAAGLVSRCIGVLLTPLLLLIVCIAANSFPREYTPRFLMTMEDQTKLIEQNRQNIARQASDQLNGPNPVLDVNAKFTPPDQPVQDIPGKQAASQKKLWQIATAVINYRLNAHHNPASLAQLFEYNPDVLRSPFWPQRLNGYAYLPDNVSDTDNDDYKIIVYDRAELDVTNATQVITNGRVVLKMSRHALLARPEIPHN